MLHMSREGRQSKSERKKLWEEILSNEKIYKEKAQMEKEFNEYFSSENIHNFQSKFSSAEIKKLKRDQNLKFSIVSGVDGGLFALYHGGLSKGDYGAVKLALELNTGKVCIMKKQFNYNSKAFKKESSFSQLRGLRVDEQLIDRKHNYLFVNLVNGITLERFAEIVKYHPLTANEEIELATNFLKALEGLKKNNIKHNDLHPGNIIIDPISMKVSFIDYGRAEELELTNEEEEEEEEGELNYALSDEEEELEDLKRMTDIEVAFGSIKKIFKKGSELHRIFKDFKSDSSLYAAWDAIDAYKGATKASRKRKLEEKLSTAPSSKEHEEDNKNKIEKVPSNPPPSKKPRA
ncbi:protein kinase domain-containing protein [Candidatus Berkiella aquae]|uniref:Protein kinase domain protein n=1 Tax=Candidatus Berkiella aquae TaxID=295108 RepID=A0A0Q9YXI2_9GAMM|nr:protein kinase family protein [Candidatus Berkiella aquae]MCS5710929.1 hypothetical protein [Candidatus Berkiella aquae]